jgi:heme/copper-type cytochrome/quinol oxidase subunit 4
MTTEDGNSTGIWRSRAGFALCVLLAAVGLLLVLEHRAHLLGSLPLLLILSVCIGMHFFMHGGHGGHDADRDDTHSGHGRGGERGQ